MTMTTQTTVAVLLVCLAAAWARDRLNSKRLRWEGHDAEARGEGPLAPRAVLVPVVSRADRKIIFINNKAYDMPEEEQDLLWYLFLHEGFVPETAHFVPEPQMDSLAAALHSPGGTAVETDGRLQVMDSAHNGLDGEGAAHESVKTSRLVSGPEEEPRDEAEAQPDAPADDLADDRLADAGTEPVSAPPADPPGAPLASPSNRTANASEPAKTKDRAEIEVAGDDKTAEVAPVRRVSVLAFLWAQLTNIGGMLGRSVVDTLSDTLWAGWLNMLQMVKSRGIGRTLPEALWNSWLSVLQYVNSRELGDPLPEALWKSWLTLLQFVKSRGRRAALDLPPE